MTEDQIAEDQAKLNKIREVMNDPQLLTEEELEWLVRMAQAAIYAVQFSKLQERITRLQASL